MPVRLEKIIESPFLVPSLDFMALNSDVRERQLENMDKHIRASINKALRIRI
jgi:hypothetical protein